MRRIGSHFLSFSLGVMVGLLAVKKGCPPVPVPADQDRPPVAAPAAAEPKAEAK